MTKISALPAAVENTLSDLVAAAQHTFQDDLLSIVLFGSGAESRLRLLSDVNLLFVFKQFQQARADDFREPLLLAHVAVKAEAMFIVESELAAAVDLFAVKFSDIARRHRVLFGELPTALQSIPPAAKKRQLLEILMNINLRLRRHYVFSSLHEEQLAVIVAETAGALRVAAATLLDLEGQAVESPKASLESFAQSLGGEGWRETLLHISEARESGRLPAGVGGPVLLRVMALAEAMRRRTEGLG